MALSDNSRQSLIPNFLYSSSKKPLLLEKMLGGAGSSLSFSGEPSSSPAGQRSFVVQAPSEPGKRIEMFSPEYYAACAVGGSLCCSLTHAAVTPLDVVKCNMQVRLLQDFSNGFLFLYNFLDDWIRSRT